MTAFPKNPMRRVMTFGVAGVATVAVALALCQPARAENVCATKASLENPAAIARPGLGGTGTPSPSAVAAWWQGLWGKGADANPSVEEGPNVLAGRPGIGGTGISSGGVGGTGIVGVITGFASICVNGVELHFDDQTPVLADGRSTTARELAVGQVVAVRAKGTGDELSALHIAVMHAVVGPIGRIDTGTGQFQVMGQTVQMTDQGELAKLKTGDWVQVSGHRLVSGTVAATRVESVAVQAQAQITGPMGLVDGRGFDLQGGRVLLDPLGLPNGAVPGVEVSVHGNWDGTVLRAQSVTVEPTRQQVGPVERVVLEGYVHALRGNQITLGNRVMTLAPGAMISGRSEGALAVNDRVQVRGRVGNDQRISVDRVTVRGNASGKGRASDAMFRTDQDKAGDNSTDSGRESGKGSDDSGRSGSESSSSGDSSSSSGSSGKGSSGSDSSGSGSSGSGSSGSGSSGSGSSGSSGSSGGGKSSGGKSGH